MIAEKLLVASVSASAGGVWFGLTEAVNMAIVAQLGALALAGLAAFVSWRTNVISKRTHDLVNSRMDEFKAMFSQAKINEGVLQEKASADIIEGKRAIVAERQVQTVAVPVASSLTEAINSVPEKTATLVVEKLDQQKP